MKKTKVFLVLPILIVTLYGCGSKVTLATNPGELACPGDTVKLTWDGADDNGVVTLSAEPAVSGLPPTGDPDGSARFGISQTTTFTASQRNSASGSASVQVPIPPLTFPVTFDIQPECPPLGSPYWTLSGAANTLISPRAIVRVVSNPSFQVRATHVDIVGIVPAGGSSGIFAGTSATVDWVFTDPSLIGRTCPPDGDTAPAPITGLMIDPSSLDPLTITIEATCPEE